MTRRKSGSLETPAVVYFTKKSDGIGRCQQYVVSTPTKQLASKILLPIIHFLEWNNFCPSTLSQEGISVYIFSIIHMTIVKHFYQN